MSPGQLLSCEPLPLSDVLTTVGAHGLRVHYESTSVNRTSTVVSGALVLPPRTEGRPVVSWGHGTTGCADSCAPSRHPDLGGFDHVVAALVEAGYVVAATDYEGLGTPGPHPYLIADSEARGLIDVVRAAHQAVGGLSPRWVAAGHSQGSQAAGRAAELGDLHGLELRGAVQLGAAIDLSRTIAARLDRIAGDHTSQAYYVLILTGLATKHPELDPADHLGMRARALLPLVDVLDLDGLTAECARLDLPGDEFRSRRLDLLRAWLREEAVPAARASVPIAVFYGEDDEIVSPPEAREAVRHARELGTDITLHTYPGVDHDGVLTASRDDHLAWIAHRLR